MRKGGRGCEGGGGGARGEKGGRGKNGLNRRLKDGVVGLTLHCHDSAGKRHINVPKWKPLSLFSSFSYWHVRGFSSKRIALKVDVTGPENTLLAGAPVYNSARTFYRVGK